MDNQPDPNSNSDDTQKFTLHLPCRLAERADKFARENGNTITGVVIEALDKFLRDHKVN
jgi:hypothetical protein